jgi:DNA-binding response OmpR family regulator
MPEREAAPCTCVERNRAFVVVRIWHSSCVIPPGCGRIILLKEVPMNRVLVIDQESVTTRTLGLACLAHGIGVVFADNVCDGVRVLLETMVDLVLVDVAALRLTPREVAALFARVAPGVPLVVAARPQTPLETRVALELAGFRVLTKPVNVDELIDKAPGV